MFQEKTFKVQKSKKPALKTFLILREMDLSCHKLEKRLHFSRELANPDKKFLIFL